MDVRIFDTKETMGQAAADDGAKAIAEALTERGRANVIVATGASQFEMLAALVAAEVDWSRVTFFHLDEYVGLPISHPASFRKYLKERFVDRLPTPPAAFHYVNGEGDCEAECRRLGQLIAGGPGLVELEQRLLETDHCEIGYILAKEWRIPDAIAEAIRDHHSDNGQISPQSPTGILQMSEYIIQQLRYPAVKEGLANNLSAPLAAHIQSNVEEYKVLAEDLPEELEKTRKMYGG